LFLSHITSHSALAAALSNSIRGKARCDRRLESSIAAVPNVNTRY